MRDGQAPPRGRRQHRALRAARVRRSFRADRDGRRAGAQATSAISGSASPSRDRHRLRTARTKRLSRKVGARTVSASSSGTSASSLHPASPPRAADPACRRTAALPARTIRLTCASGTSWWSTIHTARPLASTVSNRRHLAHRCHDRRRLADRRRATLPSRMRRQDKNPTPSLLLQPRSIRPADPSADIAPRRP
jgi:hypothetical protein